MKDGLVEDFVVSKDRIMQNKTKILFINCPNRLYRRPEFFPYGLSLLISKISQTDNTNHIELYDLNLNRDLNLFWTYLFHDSDWDIICISGLITTYEYQVDLSKMIRALIPNVLLLSGGGLSSAIPELLLSSSEIDIACLGEGEYIIKEVINRHKEKQDFSGVSGIVWKNKKYGVIIVESPAKVIDNLDILPYPDWDKGGLVNYFKFSSFSHKGINAGRLFRRADLTTTRGCPCRCSFCSNVFNRESIRLRSVENIINEIIELKSRYNIDSVDFLDENFCFSKKRVKDICNEIIKNNLNIKWGTAARADNIDEDLLLLMKEAGCIFILYGFETGSQDILDKMHKNITIEQSWNAFSLTEKIGIDARGNLMIGHPGENRKTVMESLNFQKRRYDYLIQKYDHHMKEVEFQEEMRKRFSTVSFCTPYPGSKIYEDYKSKIGNLDSFLRKITMQDAKEFVINISDLPFIELLGYQKLLSSPELWKNIKSK